jgi:short-subunit dehydrogenase
MTRVLVIGATSGMAQEAAKILAARGDRLYLLARDPERLAAVAGDLVARGAAAVAHETADFLDTDHHAALLERAWAAFGGFDAVLVAHGTLGDQQRCEADYAAAEREVRSNLLTAVSFLTDVANRFAATGNGTIAVISSVAGDRGRQSNYVYGAAKAGLSAFLQGLRNRLAHHGVRVVTIKPGFVDTPMVAHLKKGPLFASAARAGQLIVRAMDRGGDVVYLPWFWRYIMLAVIHVPERMFKRLRM